MMVGVIYHQSFGGGSIVQMVVGGQKGEYRKALSVQRLSNTQRRCQVNGIVATEDGVPTTHMPNPRWR